MKYPNAYKGLGNVLKAQILQLIGVILLIAGAALGIAVISNGDLGMAGAALILVLVGAVIAIVADIFNIIGFNQARKDEKQFMSSLICIIVALAAMIISAVTQSVNERISDWLSFVAIIFEFSAIMGAADGIRNLGSACGDGKIVKTAEMLKMFIMIAWFIVLVLRFIDNIGPEMGNILYIIAGIVEFIAFIVYIVLLSKARKMLAKEE